MNKYVTVEKLDSQLIGGGTKANDDVVNFLNEIDFDTFNILYTRSQLKKIYYSIFKLKKDLCKIKNSYVVFQYPIRSDFITKYFIKYVKKYNIKLITLVHDIVLQNNDDESKLTSEKNILNSSDIVIVHNSKMYEYLKKMGVITPMITLEIFDYDNPQKIIKDNIKYDKSVCFAGNLKKSKFLKKIKSNIDIYGPNKLNNYPGNVIYKGVYTPEELPKHLVENFGLVWDGDSVDTCSGNFGEYLKYNNPHKVSLYISSGIPVIVWSHAAIADFIINNNLGIAVESLNNLRDELNKVSEQEYLKMKKNVDNFSDKLRQGFYIKQAVNKALFKIEGNNNDK